MALDNRMVFVEKLYHCRNREHTKQHIDDNATISNGSSSVLLCVSVSYWPCRCWWWRKRGPLSAPFLSLYQSQGCCRPVKTKRGTQMDLKQASTCVVWTFWSCVRTLMKQLSRLPRDRAAVRDLQRTRGVRDVTFSERAMPPVKSSIPSEMLPPFKLP